MKRQFFDLFAGLKLQGKLFVVFSIVAIVPLIFFVYYSYHTTKKELIAQTTDSMIRSTSQISSNLENKLDAYTWVSNTIWLDSTLKNYLSRDYSENPMLVVDAYEYFDNLMKNYLTTNPDIREITIHSLNASLPKDNIFIKAMDDETLAGLISQSRQISYGLTLFDIQPKTERSPAMLSLSRLLNSDSLNFPYGVLQLHIGESELYSLMEKEIGEKQIYFIDKEGKVLSSQDKSLLNSNISDILQVHIPEDNEGIINGYYGGTKVLIAYKENKYGWKTISIIPYKSFVAKAQEVSSRFLLIALGSILLAILLLYITSRLFTRRIAYLTKMIKRVEREEFDWVMKPLGRDEIGELGAVFNHMATRLKNLINEVYKKEIAEKEAEMNVLQAQINPHFLYNTLGSISSLAIRNSDSKTYKMVNSLSKYYRISLNKGKTVISIYEEIELTKHYLDIQLIRFQDLLRIHYNIDEAIFPYQNPKLILQPFIENCINHAIWDDEVGINIIINGYIDNDRIVIEIIDDGSGMSQQKAATILTDEADGFGVKNVNERIKLFFGKEYGVSIRSRLGIGTAVRITLPLRRMS